MNDRTINKEGLNYFYHELLKLMKSSVLYTNENPTTTLIGGIEKGTTFTNTPILTVLDKLLYPYITPTINFSVTPNLIEYGADTEVTLKWSATNGSISSENYVFSILKGDEEIANSGNQTTDIISDKTTYKCTFTDGEETIHKTSTVNTGFRCYFGAINTISPTEDRIYLLISKGEIRTDAKLGLRNVCGGFTGSVNKYPFLIVPTKYWNNIKIYNMGSVFTLYVVSDYTYPLNNEAYKVVRLGNDDGYKGTQTFEFK